jgi:hypothetical protein
MAVAVVGTPTVIDAGGTYTAEAGSNRLMVFALANRTSDTSISITPTITAFTAGATSLANGQLISAVETANGSGANQRAGLWYVREADIAGGALTITPTWSHPMQSTTKIACYTLSGVHQLFPIGTTVTKAQSSTTAWQQDITAAANSAHLSAAVWGAGGISATSGAGYTEVMDHTNGGAVRAHSQYQVVSTGGVFSWAATLSSAVGGRIAIASFAETSVTAAARFAAYQMLMG